MDRKLDRDERDQLEQMLKGEEIGKQIRERQEREEGHLIGGSFEDAERCSISHKSIQMLRLTFCFLFFLLCLTPSLGLLISGQEESSENRERSVFPSLFLEDGSLNLRYLPEAGEYFQEHFGFRNELVTAIAVLSAEIGHVSSAEGVILGTDGWLFYKDSLGDFQGAGQLDLRALFDLAHTMALAQDYAESMGASFALAIAPNKNSLYGAYMPYYDRVTVSTEKNLTGIRSYLQEEGVHDADLYEALSREADARKESGGDPIYLKRDSHWNNEGAMLASREILKAQYLSTLAVPAFFLWLHHTFFE